MSDITVAASERAFVELFNKLRDDFAFSSSDSGSFGPFSAGYSFAMHLEGGTVDLRADNTFRVHELDVKYDSLSAWVGIDIPRVCVGGWCIVPTPWGCAVRLPRLCVFSANPDITIPLNLDGLLTSEVSFIASLRTAYRVDPGRQPWMDYLDADAAGVPNKWQVFIDPESVDIDLFDFADIVGDLLDAALDVAIDGLLGFLPGWARSLIRSILGPLVDLVRAILDIGDDIEEWLEDLLGTSLGLLNTVATAILDYLAGDNPLTEFEDPIEVLETSGGLIPVMVPITDFTVKVNDDEMIVEANIG
jgi:hypothetical protein